MVSAGSGPRASMPSATQPLDRRAHDQAVLLAERAVLAGVRIEAGDREPRLRDAEAVDQVARHDAAGLDDQIACEPLRHVLQRQMDRDRHDREFRRPQHHHRHAGLPVCSNESLARYSVWPGSAKPDL